MPLAFVRPLAFPILVGRDAYVDALDRLLDDADAGNGQTVCEAVTDAPGQQTCIQA